MKLTSSEGNVQEFNNEEIQLLQESLEADIDAAGLSERELHFAIAAEKLLEALGVEGYEFT